MSNPAPHPAPKTRALPRRWARLLSLKASQTFTHGGRVYYKSVVPFIGVEILRGCRRFFAPWTRVRTAMLVRDARPGGKSSIQGEEITREQAYEGLGDPATWAANKTALDAEFKAKPNDGQTHFVGDSCPGGHGEYRGPVQQPSSDNDVSGPTS